MNHRTYLLPLLLAALACGEDMAPPRPQWLVVVTTDAVVPLMGDRLRVELLDQEGDLACPSCRREAEVALEDRWPVSFGIASPSSSTEVYVRAQLYRGDRLIAPSDGSLSDGLRTTLDFLGVLPKLQDGVNQVGIHLVADCLGKPVTGTIAEGFLTCSSEPFAMQTPPTLGPPRDDLDPNGGVGTTHLMPSEEHRKCPVTVSDDSMVCIPGGLFFVGSALAPVPSKDVLAVSYPERLVAVRSFLMDEHEVTVEQFKDKLGAEWPCDSSVKPVWCWDKESPNSKAYHCTYSPNDSGRDSLPVNCISWGLAFQYCKSLEKRLPTEIEWEYAASNGMLETRHPWGNEVPQCDSASVGRGVEAWRDNFECRVTQADEGPVVPNDGSDDRTEAGVFELAGNLSEWTSTQFSAFAPKNPKDPEAPKDPNCWQLSGGPLLDLDGPSFQKCTHEATEIGPSESETWVADNTKMSLRGGSWRDSLQSTWSASRNSASADSRIPRPEIGFRCVRDIKP